MNIHYAIKQLERKKKTREKYKYYRIYDVIGRKIKKNKRIDRV